MQYDNCNDCPFLELPDINGVIILPNEGHLILNKTVLSKNGEIPNPLKGRCGVKGKILKELNGCSLWHTSPKYPDEYEN